MAAVPYDSPSGIGLGQRDPWTVKHIRPLDKWPDNASEQERLWNGRVVRVPSFNYEFGSRTGRELVDDPKLEDEDKFVEYFKTFLYGKPYKTYVCEMGDQEPVVVVIQGKEKAQPGPMVAKKMQSRKDDERLLIPLIAGKVRIKEMLRQLRPDLQGAEFRQIVDDTIDADLLDFMTKQIVTNYKFGVLYQRAGQTEEDQWYNNMDGSLELEEFLTFLGERITLNGFTKFRGGLSVTDEKTGTHSIYTSLNSLEIMFHVSTYIPYYPNDPQQVERKRHLGNDVVVIVFRESDCKDPFDPMKIKSQFNHTFCIVQPTAKESGVTHYKICFLSRDSGQPYGPVLPAMQSFPRGEKLRKWLLTKLINAERAAMYSPEFKERLWKARKMILYDLVSRHSGSSHRTRVGAGVATGVDAVGGGLKMMLAAPVTVARAVPLPLPHRNDGDLKPPAPPLTLRSPGRSAANENEPLAISASENPTLLSTSFGSPKKSPSDLPAMLHSSRGEHKERKEQKEREKAEKERQEREAAEKEKQEKERRDREKREKELKEQKERELAVQREMEAAALQRERELAAQREKERAKELAAQAAAAAALPKERHPPVAASPRSITAPLVIAPEDRPVFMEDEGFLPPVASRGKDTKDKKRGTKR